MSIVASQLIGKVSIEGADQAKSILLGMADNSKKAQDQLNQLQNAAKDVGSILSSRLASDIKSAQSGLQDLGSRASAAGLDVSKFTSLQQKASEAAAKLGVAQAQAAAAQERANAITNEGSASAEQIALAQAKAALAAENVQKAEMAAADAMSMVQGEATRLADALEMAQSKGGLFSGVLGGLKTGASGFFGAIAEAPGKLMEATQKIGLFIFGVQQIIQTGQQVAGVFVELGKKAGDFQEGITQLSTGAGELNSNLGLVSAGLLKMAPDVGESTKELEDGMYLVESAGQHGAQALTTLKDAAEGAKVGNAALKDVANGVTTEMTDYAKANLSSAEATNTLIAAVSMGKTQVGALSTAMSTILPTSAAVGVSLGDTAAAMATMTSEGTDASSAATYLRQLLMALEAPAKKGADALKSIGLSTSDVASEMRVSLPGALQMITDHLKNKFPEGSAAYVAALKDIAGGSRQMQGILELTGDHLQVFKDDVAGIADSVKKGGNSITGWSKVQEDFNFQMERAQEGVETLQIKLGTKLFPVFSQVFGWVSSTALPALSSFSDWFFDKGIPALQNFISPLQTLGHWFQDFVGRGQAAIPILAGIGAVIATVLVPAVWSLAAGVVTATWPFLAIGAAVAGVTAIFLHFYNTNAGFRDFINGIGTAISTNFMPAIQKIGSFISSAFTPILQKLGDFLVSTFKPVWDQLVDTWKTSLLPSLQQLWAALQPLAPLFQFIAGVAGVALLMMFASLIGVIKGLAQGIAAFVSGVSTIVAGFVQTATGLVQVVTGVVRIITDIFTGNFKDLGAALGQIGQGILNILGGLFKGMVGAFQATFGTIWGLVSGFVMGVIGFFVDLYNRLVGHSIIPDLVNGIVKWFSSLPGKLLGFWNTIKTDIGNTWTWITSHISDACKNIYDTVNDKANSIKTNTINIFRALVNGVVDLLNDGISSVESFINFFGNGINSVAAAFNVKSPIPTAHLGRIPHYASGTNSHPGGYMITGEEGPELTWAPPGTKVVRHKETMQILGMLGGKVPGYADGIGDIGSKILGWLSGGAKSILDNVISTLHISAPNLPGMGNIASAMFGKVKDWALGWIDKILPHFDFGGMIGQKVDIPGNLQSWIMQAMALTGAPGSWASPLAIIAMHESGGNPNAINLTDSNALAGHPSQGIMQTIPSTFAAYALPGYNKNILDPISNISASIRYIQARYGDVFHVPGIISLSQGHGYVGYAEGGTILEPIIGKGLRTGKNYAFGEKGPEMVVPGTYIPSGVNLSSQNNNPIHITINVQPNDLNVDGRRLASALMPHIVSEIRHRTGATI